MVVLPQWMSVYACWEHSFVVITDTSMLYCGEQTL